MVQPKRAAAKSSTTTTTSPWVVTAVKILFVLLILLLLPKLVQAKRKARKPRLGVQARQLRQFCETDVCQGGFLEENLNCISFCISPACYEQVYGDGPLEDGEVDWPRALAFDECQVKGSRLVRQRMRQDKRK
jgi:hypothetical protein